MWLVDNISRILHDTLFRDHSQSLCARAWQRRNRSLFWKAWVFVFGRNHCRSSWEFYHME